MLSRPLVYCAYCGGVCTRLIEFHTQPFTERKYKDYNNLTTEMR